MWKEERNYEKIKEKKKNMNEKERNLRTRDRETRKTQNEKRIMKESGTKSEVRRERDRDSISVCGC